MARPWQRSVGTPPSPTLSGYSASHETESDSDIQEAVMCPPLPRDSPNIIWEAAIDCPLLVVCGREHAECVDMMAKTTRSLGQVTCWHHSSPGPFFIVCRESQSVASRSYGSRPTREPVLLADNKKALARLRTVIDFFMPLLPEILSVILERGVKHIAFPASLAMEPKSDKTTDAQWAAECFFHHWAEIKRFHNRLTHHGHDLATLETCTLVLPRNSNHRKQCHGGGAFPFAQDEYPVKDPRGGMLSFQSPLRRLIKSGAIGRIFSKYRNVMFAYGEGDWIVPCSVRTTYMRDKDKEPRGL
ncbi:hypothetical protein Micbo1qcDRAFT_177811 [Microdochium bolleyi]|uniref:Uncharacterized protein n=1 Tax=Microdochium bolleyi TaxID=196109 RepID=A0A136IUP0_9PEZI|nr:hypothetical protein Micbo1qcDRAFT_177811 [Microdochium bolleyi]